MIAIAPHPIDVALILDSVKADSAGGIDIFIGTTRARSGNRTVVSLEYEAYEPMASRVMTDISEVARRRWDIVHISMVHRTGKVGIGEASVVIAVSAVHRKEAFEACRFVIDTLKKDVPIWKKEIFTDGQEWAGPQANTPALS